MNTKKVVYLMVQKGKQVTQRIAESFTSPTLPPPQTQSEIDKRDRNQPAEREITRRLEKMGYENV